MSEQNLLDKTVLETSVSDFSISDEDSGVMASGFDTSIRYRDKRAVIDLQTKDAVFFLKEMLREPVSAEILQGTLTLDFSDDDLQVYSEKIQLKNSHINSFSRLKLQFSAENNIPRNNTLKNMHC